MLFFNIVFINLFRNSTNPSAKGTYELKEAYFKDYNPYYYHYSRIEKTKVSFMIN